MSSTSRGGRRSEADNYPTPNWCVQRLLEDSHWRLPDGVWCEPCAGDGAIVRAVNAFREQRRLSPLQWQVGDLRAKTRVFLDPLVGPANVEIADYRESQLRRKPVQVLITNPPFSLAEQILRAARTHSQHVLLLLRLNFLGSEQRYSYLQQHRPENIFVLPNRPAFKGDGKTDSIEYAWFHWSPCDVEHSKLYTLALTPLAERRSALAPTECEV